MRQVGVAGFGRAGTALATALATAGCPVVGHSSSAGGLDRARAAGVEVVPGLDVLVASSDTVVLAVPDGAIGTVAAAVAATGRLGRRHVVVHLSGRHGLAALEAVTPTGATRGAAHPVMTLSGGVEDARRLAGTPFGVTADSAAVAAVDELVTAVGGRAMPVPDEARPAYHAGIVLGANFLGTLVNSAVDLLAAAGIPAGGDLLGPLLRASLDNALRAGDAAATGPVRRADAETLSAHLAAIADVAPWVRPAYVTLAMLTAERFVREGLLDPAAAEAVRVTLGREPGPC